jgi:cytochrome c biogenesis protein CcmG, thiol:disulfide interchange protein DsbE
MTAALATFSVLFGTVYPRVSEMYFNFVNFPILIVVLLLMGVGPLIAWRHASLDHLRRNFLAPAAVALAAVTALAVAGIANVQVLIVVALAVFVVATIVHDQGDGQPAARMALGRRFHRHGGHRVGDPSRSSSKGGVMMWRRALLTAIAVLVPIAVLAHGLRANPRSVPSPLVGQAAPDFGLRRLDRGDHLRLATLRGQVVVVNFWASWCVPCREETAALEAVWRAYREAGVVVIGVNVEDQESAAKAFPDATRPTYPNVTDPTGGTSIAYGIYGVPETFVIDRDGTIRGKVVGAVTADALSEQVASLVRARS